MSPWGREEICERLRELVVDEKLSFANVAAKLNKEFGISLSRSACIARAHRQGIDIPGERRKFIGTRKRTNAGAITRALIAKSVRKEPEPLPPPPVNDEDIPLEQRKTLMELTSETCRWPIGEGVGLFFCGALPAPGKPYCSAHCARAWAKPLDVSDEDRERRRLNFLRVMPKRNGKPYTFAQTRTDEEAA